MQIFTRPDFYVPLAMATSLLDQSAEGLLRGPRRPRAERQGATARQATTLEQARGELAALARDFEREYPALNRDRGAAVHTQFEMRTRGDDINWKFGVIFIDPRRSRVLLVACTNVAGLLLSRGPHAHARDRRSAGARAPGAPG